MYYDFKCIIKDNIPIACGIYNKSNYPDILEDKYETYCGGGVVEWFIRMMCYYNELFKETFGINIPLKEDSITPLYSSCYYMDKDIVRDHDRLIGNFRGYARNKCNLQAENTLFQYMHIILLIMITTYL